jgi:hypothetical protein
VQLNVSTAVNVPTVPGLHGLVWDLRVSNQVVGKVNLNVEVTCSDGDFCNGVERYAAFIGVLKRIP